MLLADLSSVLASCPPTSTLEDYKRAVIDENVAGKATYSSRQRTYRYLRELYALDPAVPEFRALLRLWSRDVQGRRQMALLMAVERDSALASTTPAILSLVESEVVTSADLAEAVEREYPGAYSDKIRAKIGRNALSSWTQSGYLARVKRNAVLRRVVDPTPGAVALALVIGLNEGRTGERLFESSSALVIDCSSVTLHDRAHDAARKGWLEYRSRGGVTEIDLSALTAGLDDSRVPVAEGLAS